MSWSDRLAQLVTERRRIVLAVLLITTLVVGAGSVHVEESTSFQSVEGQSAVMQKNDYVRQHFDGTGNRTAQVLVVTRNESGDVLRKGSLLRTLRYQRSLQQNGTVNETLVENDSITSVASVVGHAAVMKERQDELQDRAEQLQERNESLAADASSLRNDSQRLQNRSDRLNRTSARLYRSLLTARTLQRQIDEADESQNEQLATRLRAVRANATRSLNESQSMAFNRSFERIRSLQRDFDRLNESHANGSVSDAEYDQRSEALRDQLQAAIKNGSQGVLMSEFAAVQQRATELEERGNELQDQQKQLMDDFEALENATESLLSSPPDPTTSEQIEQLKSMESSKVEELITDLFESNTANPLGQLGLKLLPKEYEPGTATADARMMVVTQRTEVDTTSGATLTDRTIDAQLAVRNLAKTDSSANYVVFGQGFVTTEESRSMSDSFMIIGPLALVFVLLTLVLAYRDLVDIALGMLGVVLVLVWTFGLMGWLGMVFNQIMIAVPVLLIGLSIDYSVHVVMRYREERADGRSIENAMRKAVGTVGVALTLVTATTAVGFLTNLTSSLPAIRKFGIVSAIGIVSALLVFGAFIPALKIELDNLLKRVGFNREKRAIGTGGGRLSSALTVGVWAARKAPLAVLVLALVVSATSAYAGSQVNSSFSEERFISDDPPEWTQSLPEPFAPGEYTVKENLHYIHGNFQSPDKQVSMLVEGNVTDAKTLDRLAKAERAANQSDVIYVGPGGNPAVTSPLSVVRQVARQNETVNETLLAADTDGDGVPDRNVEAVYNALFEAAPDRASRVIHRTDGGEYEAVRMSISVVGSASPSAVAAEAKAIAATAEHGDATATATGGPVVDKELMERVTSTVAESLALTVGLVFVLLMVAFWLTGNPASLGGLTLVPTLLSVSWILGTMYVLDIPFSFTTAVIGSISIGLGVDYGIHVSERYNHELSQREDPWDALTRTVSGTGGALLSSAVTTTIGFGVLMFTLLPGLRQFGLIIALSLVYAFISSVFVLPSLLALWTRFATDKTMNRTRTAEEAATDD